MIYEDEQIVELRKAGLREQEINIRQGAYIDNQFVPFFFRKLWDDIEIYIPDNFIEMPEEIKTMKYPSVNRPQIILTSLDTKINLAFNFVEEKVMPEQEESFLVAMKEIIKRTNPAVNFYQEKKGTLPQGQRIYMFDFISHGIDEDLYNMVSFSSLKHGMLQGIFNCPKEYSESWQEPAWQAFQTIDM